MIAESNNHFLLRGDVPLNKLDYYEIGRKIRRFREELGLSQEAAAERCGISPSFYSNIERGVKVMSLETFVSICSAFSVSADYLLSDNLPESDEILLHSISEAKKFGSAQYEKYVRTIQALADVADRL